MAMAGLVVLMIEDSHLAANDSLLSTPVAPCHCINSLDFSKPGGSPRRCIAIEREIGGGKTRGVPGIWIGPSSGTASDPFKKTFRRVREVSDYLSQIGGPCHYAESLAFPTPNQWSMGSGLHMAGQGNGAWDKYLVSSIDQIIQGLPPQ
jgi:hypothetical protein